MVLYVWSINALLQLTSLMTDVNSLCKSSVGWAQSSCWQTAWMNHVPETSWEWIKQPTMVGEPQELSLESFQSDQSPVCCLGLPSGFTIFPYHSTVHFIAHYSTQDCGWQGGPGAGFSLLTLVLSASLHQYYIILATDSIIMEIKTVLPSTFMSCDWYSTLNKKVPLKKLHIFNDLLS